jgi:hypothetical protein
MKRFIIALLITLFASTSMAQILPDALLDLAPTQIATGTQWHFCTSPAPISYAEATGAKSLANVTVTAGSGNGDYTLQDDAVNGGRELVLLAQDPITLTANGTAVFHCVVNPTGSVFLGCTDINGGTGRAITDYTTETATYDGGSKFQFRDIQ